MTNEFFKTKIEEAKAEGTEYDDGGVCAYQQEVKEKLLKMIDKLKAYEKQDSPAFKPFYNQFYKTIKKTAKELGIDLEEIKNGS
jgi:TRAP-type C4-dicarboxylate transport system substrate-binding protein